MPEAIPVRPFGDGDREDVVALWHRAKRAAYPFLPAEQTRTLDEDRAFFRNSIERRCHVWVAEHAGRVVAYLALEGAVVDRLYVDPNARRQGVGSALLDHAKTLCPAGLDLYTHVKNHAARDFYVRHGFRVVEFGVSPPPESEPDVLYRWTPAGRHTGSMSPFHQRPAADDYAPYYAGYVALVPDGDVLEELDRQLGTYRSVLAGVRADRDDFRYADGKWTVREVVRHVVETERVFGYRALCFARRDPTPLPGYDQDLYVANGGGDRRSVAQLADAFEHLRRANLSLFATFEPDDLAHRGRMWEKELTLLSLVCLVHGHAEHHLRVLRERYGVTGDGTGGGTRGR